MAQSIQGNYNKPGTFAAGYLQSKTMSRPKGLLDLPQELRDEIYEYIVIKPSNTITMLENHHCFENEVSASQPAISRVNKQLRAETLPMYYKNNLFLAELSNCMDLAIAKSWLRAIGDGNIYHLRRLAVCGWTKVTFAHMKCRLWLRTTFNLKDGTLEIEGNEAKIDDSRHIFKDMDPMRDAYRALVEARKDAGFDLETLGRLMEGFHELCLDDSQHGDVSELQARTSRLRGSSRDIKDE